MPLSSHITFYRFFLFSVLTIALLLPVDAFCKLSAEAELNYVNLDVSENGNKHLSAHSFSQHYSLLYQTEGKFVDGKMGKYKLALGYDWSTFDTSIKSDISKETHQSSRGHFLYLGELVIDPKQIPLRLTAYSRDMTRNIFTWDESNLLGAMTGNSQIGNPQLSTGIMNGIHMDSGATLVMGVKNGMTNGYNEVLRHFPMLMLDYRDLVNHDPNSSYPVDNRFSRLAFVSLNKKDNWFHYRLLSYDDYINPDNNYKETQIQLGTVDHIMQRRWIDFSNWLMVSADGQLTKRTNASRGSNFEEFDLNLFGIARRSSWEARSLNNFNRYKEENGTITYRTTVPVYANGSWSADTSWNTRLLYKESHDSLNNKFTDILGGYRIDAFKRSSFTLSQQLELEKASTNTDELFVISAGLETVSTSRFSRNVGLGAAYTIRNYSTERNSDNSNFLDQTIRANAAYSPSRQTRVSLNQTVRVTSGTSQHIRSSVLGTNLETPQYYNPRNYSGENGSSYQSITNLLFEWNPLPRLNIGLSATEDIFAPHGGPRSYQTLITQTINYSGPNLKLSSANTFSYDTAKQSISTNTFTSRNKASYTHSRNLDSNLYVTYNKAFDNSSESDVFNIGQGLNYSFYKINGVTRKLFEISEFIDHTEGNSTDSNSPTIGPDSYSTPNTNIVTRNRNSKRNTNLTLGFKYYPVRQLLLAAGTRYTFFSGVSDYSLTYYGAIAVNYRLLQASLDYIYGTSRADGRIEKKFTANFRKIF